MRTFLILAMGILAISQSCKKDDDPVDKPPVVNEEELITTVILQLTDSANSSNTVSATFDDPDGEGGNPPVTFDSLKLAAHTTYYTDVLLLDRSGTVADTISHEVKEEADEHLFIYKPQGVDISISYRDKDNNNLPLGLQTTWRTGNSGQGSLKLILKHQPEGKDGTEAPGETDVEVDFPVRIQ